MPKHEPSSDPDAVHVHALDLAKVPALAMGELYLATSQALARSAKNAALMQMLGDVTMIATTAAGVSRILASKTKPPPSPTDLYDQYLEDARKLGIPV